MILVTVGTQLPFDRLIETMDAIAPELDHHVIAQTGEGAAYRPHHLDARARVPASEFERLFAEATLVVGHAGIGTILMARRHGKPLILFPRKASAGEHRNDHQQATAAAVRTRPGIYLAQDRDELRALLSGDLAAPRPDLGSRERDSLMAALREDIALGRPIADAPVAPAPTR